MVIDPVCEVVCVLFPIIVVSSAVYSSSYQVISLTEGQLPAATHPVYEGWNFNSGNYLFTTDTK